MGQAATPHQFYRPRDAVTGFAIGVVANICGIWMVLPHTHFLSPDAMNGILNSWPESLSVHLVIVHLFSTLCVAAAMSASRGNVTNLPGGIPLFPAQARWYQKIALWMVPPIATLVAALAWAVLLGSETLMWPDFVGGIIESGRGPLANWAVWIVALVSSAAAAKLIYGFQIQPEAAQS